MGLPKHIINLDEFAKKFSEIELTPDFNLDDLEELIKGKLDEILDLLKELLQQNKTFRSVDMSKHIPAIVNTFVISRTFQQDAYITGITFSQTAWKVEDTISLELNGVLIINGIHTKELGQQKYFNAFVPIKAGDEVRIVYNNASGNSKMFFCDLDYIFEIGKEKENVI